MQKLNPLLRVLYYNVSHVHSYESSPILFNSLIERAIERNKGFFNVNLGVLGKVSDLKVRL